ncbi:SDR family NAD(P)-dependent oxidoreductase [Pseudomonas chlororaphis]|uniref:SDR family NAD(P)-dependent oxidoreductase n=1 Tax=Pseudomonas chlororaphis TaxID=587753 RepID=UPI001B30B66A|nr:SDR family oxidoreductase [Pseudomonas chlororaphis]MBP5059559.1 SDR family oxidoreductase [Pseudomonas chlororaphis]MBP5143437.1 SDR family oxidoreductase [Pseudomonas chlororaphis]QTT98267.1 SDR family oxidoreductase [Pseudomonas chlororaphis]
MNSLAGKVVLVTGGSRGIGAAIARTLAAHGADVAITYGTSRDKAEAVVAEIRALGRRAEAIPADAADAAHVIAAVDKTAASFGRLDILVNNAGNFLTGTIDQLTLDDFERTFSVNLRAVFAATVQAVKYLPDGGRIVSIGSCLAPRAGRGGISLYAASKAALVGLTKGIARDLGPRRITVNLVHPGPIDTDMNPADGPRAASTLAALALPAYGQPDDIAATVLHLAGDAGRYITGAEIDVDGGFNA